MLFYRTDLLRSDLLEHHVEGALSGGQLQSGVLTGVAKIETVSRSIHGDDRTINDISGGGEVLILGSGNAVSKVQQSLFSLVAV